MADEMLIAPFNDFGHPTLFEVVFTDREVRDYRDVFAADFARTENAIVAAVRAVSEE